MSSPHRNKSVKYRRRGDLIDSKYSLNPLYPALERLPFCRVSKLTHCGPERQCNPARDRNPAKGKPLLRQGTDGNFH
ncbi:MAG: hypothetical protein JRI35_05530, partial [Deltaproteobacteria bacterium]|nr:hypothetical protein [Deltaproteobacteria bacterium]